MHYLFHIRIIAITIFLTLWLAYAAAQKSNLRHTSYHEYYVRIQSFPDNTEHNLDSTTNDNKFKVWLQSLFNAALSGDIQAYSYYKDTKPMSPNHLRKSLQISDTLLTIDPNSLMQTITIDTWDISWRDVNLIAFIECWKITPKGSLTKNVIAFAPVYEVKDNSIHFDHLRNHLFWIKNKKKIHLLNPNKFLTPME